MLHGIRREILDRLLFPVGSYKKTQIREIARNAGLSVADEAGQRRNLLRAEW